MAGGNTIGTGALILTANADKMLATLDRAGKQAQDKAKKIGDGINKGGGIGAMAGGFLGGFLGAAAGQMVEEPLKKIGTAMLEAVNGAHEFRLELQRSAEMAEQTAKAMDRSLRRMDEKVGALADPKAALAELEKQASFIKGSLDAERKVKDAAQDALNKLNDSGSKESWEAFMGGMLEDKIKGAEQAMNAAAGTVGKLSDRYADLNEKIARLKNPASDPSVMGAVNALTESLKLQADTFGMTGAQAQIAALKAKGATDGMLKAAQAQADRLDELEKHAKGPEPIKLSGAMAKGSTEAYSLTTKFQAAGMLAQDEAKKQAAEAKEGNRLLKQLVNLVSGAQIVQEG
jgi:hypothetical protein